MSLNTLRSLLPDAELTQSSYRLYPYENYAMNKKRTNAYMIRNFRRIKKTAYTRIVCINFASVLFT